MPGFDEVLSERINSLRDALDKIVAAHLGDCPAAMDETDFARAHNHRVRTIARNALLADEARDLAQPAHSVHIYQIIGQP